MYLILTLICVAVLCSLIVLWIKRTRERREVEEQSITPEELHTLLTSNHEVFLFDVRQPLDLLADSEIIPGAKRIPPREILEDSSIIPRDKDAVAYCTCPGDKTARAITNRARSMQLYRVKFLKGGLAAWKAKGYPIEPYQETFHLDTAP